MEYNFKHEKGGSRGKGQSVENQGKCVKKTLKRTKHNQKEYLDPPYILNTIKGTHDIV